MQPETIDVGLVIFLVATFAIFAFFIYALSRARARRRAELEEPERRAEVEEALPPAAEELAEEEVPPERPEEPRPRAEVPRAPPAPAPDARLQQGLKRTQESLLGRLGSLFGGKEIPSDLFNQVEEILLTSDVGVKTTNTLLDKLKTQLSRSDLKDQATLFSALEQDIKDLLVSADGQHWSLPDQKPSVLLMVGVNGVGKTTTIGKLAAQLRAQDKSVLLVAGDTFRAGAADQLKVWAERSGSSYFGGVAGKDPASVIFEGCKQGVEQGVDVIICDTAGRLHTKTNLMEELKKCRRVIAKVVADGPHDVFLVVDATTGQNAVAQAREFNEALGLSGLVLTKLDGTAKGGVIIAITAELKLPIRFIGVGESIEDLRPFRPEDFAHALFAR